jgi:hypothetical protein
MEKSNLFMVFDVESVGLHGEGFAVGYRVIRADGTRPNDEDEDMPSDHYIWCDPAKARGDDASRAWVMANVHVPTIKPTGQPFGDPRQVRECFWDHWMFWKQHGAILVADCLWPVEARFLGACVDDDPANRNWQGPYPFHELASIRLAAGLDPLGTEDRLPDEQPAHNALADARQSARLLIEALGSMQSSDQRSDS